MLEADTSSSLLLRVRKQDREGWRLLVEWISPFILRWCQRAHFQGSDCDDIAQSVLKKIWASFSSFHKEKPGDSFRAWVYTITRNECRNLFAKQRSDGSHTMVDITLPTECEPSEAADLQQRAILLLLQSVTAQYKDDNGFKAFYRTAVDGLTSTEVAAELGMEQATVRQHKSLWIRHLRDRLQVEFTELLG